MRRRRAPWLRITDVNDPTGLSRMLRALGLEVEMSRAPRPALVAVIEGRRGRVELR
jgi:hypothetical protein